MRGPYPPEPAYEHGRVKPTGILLANLGTPDAPTAPALRRYLRQFLSDPRVIEEPRWKWWPILHLLVLPFRPRRSAELYRKIWAEEGSPLLLGMRSLAEKVSAELDRRVGSPLALEIGMRYGSPSIPEALGRLRRAGVDRLLVLPLFPQYSGTTVASVFDAVTAELSDWRAVPALRTVHRYHDRPAYVAELADSIGELWEREGQPEKLLFSFHGIPLRYFEGGDPYHCECHKTARLVAERLRLPDQRWEVAFQSIFGREKWIRPTTDVTVKAMAKAGVRSLDVICPGFSVDCLETLEEIDQLNREIFLEHGGESFRYVPCLNDRPGHAAALARLALENLSGWVTPAEAWDPEAVRAAAEASRRRAEEVRRRGMPADAGYGSA